VANSRNVDPTLQVTYICTPDSELRIAHAVEILLAAAYPNQDCTVRADESENRENDSSENEHEGDFAGDGR